MIDRAVGIPTKLVNPANPNCRARSFMTDWTVTARLPLWNN